MDEMFFIRLYPNGVTQRQEDGGRFREMEVGYRFLSSQQNGRPVWVLLWLLNDEPVRVTFECHCRLMAETIMKFLVVAVEAGSLSVPQPSDRTGPLVHATPLCIQEPAGEGLEAEIGSSEADSDYLGESGSSSKDPNCDEYVMDTPTGLPRYIFPATLPIPKLEDVLCFYHQLDLDAMGLAIRSVLVLLMIITPMEALSFELGIG
ncbi:hypothetical protein PIB30_006088 [Stylosanthes scabra]|uniref:Uncharacterized protein n=1 Tax=Stylosanthes scabra TaxID=79078 RepID=A0ABU6V7B5_9FABA|nr:hypothetical protein [Stylosanthes scabra]